MESAELQALEAVKAALISDGEVVTEHAPRSVSTRDTFCADWQDGGSACACSLTRA